MQHLIGKVVEPINRTPLGGTPWLRENARAALVSLPTRSERTNAVFSASGRTIPYLPPHATDDELRKLIAECTREKTKRKAEATTLAAPEDAPKKQQKTQTSDTAASAAGAGAGAGAGASAEVAPAIPTPIPQPKRFVLPKSVQILNVKSPWAKALVTGWKNIENRTSPIPARAGAFPMYVLILSSRSYPSKKTMEDFRRRAVSNGRIAEGEEVASLFTINRGCILGMVQFLSDTATARYPNVWWNGPPDRALRVGRTSEFKHPIRNITGSQTPFVYARKHAQWKEIEEGLRRNDIFVDNE